MWSSFVCRPRLRTFSAVSKHASYRIVLVVLVVGVPFTRGCIVADITLSPQTILAIAHFGNVVRSRFDFWVLTGTFHSPGLEISTYSFHSLRLLTFLTMVQRSWSLRTLPPKNWITYTPLTSRKTKVQVSRVLPIPQNYGAYVSRYLALRPRLPLEIKGAYTGSMAVAAACDIVIAGAMWHLLDSRRSGVKR